MVTYLCHKDLIPSYYSLRAVSHFLYFRAVVTLVACEVIATAPLPLGYIIHKQHGLPCALSFHPNARKGTVLTACMVLTLS